MDTLLPNCRVIHDPPLILKGEVGNDTYETRITASRIDSQGLLQCDYTCKFKNWEDTHATIDTLVSNQMWVDVVLYARDLILSPRVTTLVYEGTF